MGAPKTAPLREQVISEITVARGWNKEDATALVDALIAEVAATPAPLDGHQTPGEYHDYRVACVKCGEPGWRTRVVATGDVGRTGFHRRTQRTGGRP